MPKKKREPKQDGGMSNDQIKKIRAATRQIWRWSLAHKLVVDRCLDKHGFSICELCKKKVPRVFVDHITPVGLIDGGYFDRLLVPSKKMQGLCKTCHGAKTRKERMCLNNKVKGF